ncbi:MAG: hypothetical protein AB8B59_04635 [Maribacter sp.]
MKLKYLRIWSIILGLGLIFACAKDADDTLNSVDKAANLLVTGESANDFLSNDKFTNLKIEIAHVVGFRPTQGAILLLTNYLKTYTFKENIEIVYSELPSPNKETLTIQEIADIETKNRTVYNDGNTLGIFIYFADAPDEDDEAESSATLGAVYRNTTMVIYESTVRRIANRNLIRDALVESATINHEFGHLLGLVNLGTTAINNHIDAESSNHCNVAGCLMGAELQFGRIGKSSNLISKNIGNLNSSCSLSEKSLMHILKNNSSKGFLNSVPLDAECILDLKSNGGR